MRNEADRSEDFVGVAGSDVLGEGAVDLLDARGVPVGEEGGGGRGGFGEEDDARGGRQECNLWRGSEVKHLAVEPFWAMIGVFLSPYSGDEEDEGPGATWYRSEAAAREGAAWEFGFWGKRSVSAAS